MPHCEVEAQEHEALQRNHHARRDARVPGGSRSRRHGKQVTKAKREAISETDSDVSCYQRQPSWSLLLLQIDWAKRRFPSDRRLL